MRYFVQLRLLLWKNWLLRRRNLLRTLVELLWPILIFCFLILLHNMGERRKIPDCFFKPKAMPSAGDLLFLQTTLCSLNNTCDPKENATMDEYQDSQLSVIGLALKTMLQLEKPKDEGGTDEKSESPLLKRRSLVPDSIPVRFDDVVNLLAKNEIPLEREEEKELLSDYFILESISQDMRSRLRDEMVESEKSSVVKAEFLFGIVNETNTSTIFKREANMAADLAVLAQGKNNIMLTSAMNSFMHYTNYDPEQGMNFSSINSSVLNFVDFLLCGPRVPPLIDQFIAIMSDRPLGMRYSMSDSISGLQHQFDSSWENDTTEYCNYLMKTISQQEEYKAAYTMLKPFFRGKILYAPDAPVVNRIMNRVNESVNKVKVMKDFVEEAVGNDESIKTLRGIITLYLQDKKFLRRMVKSDVVKDFLRFHGSKAEGGENDPKTIAADMRTFSNLMEGTAKKFESTNNVSAATSEIKKLIPLFECYDYNRLIPVKDESAAVDESLRWLSHERLAAVVVFLNVPNDADKLPPSLKYKIRTGMERTPKTTQIRDRVYVAGVKRDVFFDMKPIIGGFAFLQNLIETEIIKEYTNKTSAPGIFLQQTPFPCHIYDSSMDIITRTLPVFMIISWCYAFGMLIKKIVTEKENHLKGTLRIFGVYNSQHWIAWFIDSFIPAVLISLILSLILVVGKVIPNSSVWLIWAFLTTFSVPTICFAFLVSTFFSRSSFSLNVSMVIFFLLYLVYPPIQNFSEVINPKLKQASCLISNVAFGLGCMWLANMEEIGLGAQFQHTGYSPVLGNPITMDFIIIMFFVDGLIYLLIAVYLENIYRVEESARLPWYYPFTLSYWMNRPKKKTTFVGGPDNIGNKEHIEAEPEGLPVGIETVNLTKEYGKGSKKRKVVNNLSMRFYENQITSFLGHNGAGKTTSISMMSGLLPISSGVVLIYGINLEKDPEIAAKDIGICRQENVLLEDLSVEEHLYLFSRLKNRSVRETRKDSREIIEDLKLGHRAKAPVHTLSGGMKRKVCLAMAFIGGPRTIFLDEPTAGVDPFSRRSIWDLLLKYKKGRTVILTTHFLDEADILGDRIAIIGRGKLQCCGSSTFLKNNYGKGYYLTIESKIRSDKSGRSILWNEEGEVLSSQANELKNMIGKKVPNVIYLEQIGSEITFIIPTGTSPSAYDDLLDTLDKKKDDLNIVSYGISNTSLGEVFFTIIQNMEDEEREAGQTPKNPLVNEAQVFPDSTFSPPEKKNESVDEVAEEEIRQRMADMKISKIITQQFFALLIKRFQHHRRNYNLLLIEILLPAVFIAIALLLVLTLPSIEEMPPLTIDVSLYSPSVMFYSNDYPNEPIIEAYEKTLLGSHGLDVLSSDAMEEYPVKCINEISDDDNEDDDSKKSLKECSCEDGIYKCVTPKSYCEPPHFKVPNGDVLYNLTSIDVREWLITTEFNLSSIRYGGVSLGYFNEWTGITVSDFLNLLMMKKFVSLLLGNSYDGKPFSANNLADYLLKASINFTFAKELYENRSLVDNIFVWYNNRGWFASLAYMNGISNLVLRASLPEGEDPSNYSITLINHPLPVTKRQLEEDVAVQTNTALLTAIAIIWALSFIPAMFAIYVVEERVSGLKHLQIVSGISKSVYWIVALLWDMALYSLNVITIIILFLIFNVQSYVNEDCFGIFILLLFVYGFANIAFVYSISYLFVNPSAAFVFVACYNIFIGMITLWTTFFLDLISGIEDPLHLNKVFLIFPPFCFGKALVKIALAYNNVQILKSMGLEFEVNYASWSISMKYMVVMICVGTLFFIITILIQFRFLPVCARKRKVKKERNFDYEGEEEDVKMERLRIQAIQDVDEGANDLLVVNNLTKIYCSSKTPAVDGICFGVKRGECFGLLGLNGAGKTTVFKMLTGYLPISDGDAIIGGYSLRTNIRRARLLTGYCPQGDALDPYLTCEEHLSLFSRIRGITGKRRRELINKNIDRLGLTPHRHKIVKILSGGNKRKLNTAIALMGEPALVLLDEPTTGMDSHSRRFVWKCIQKIVNEGRCVVLTSHNMEECQALCTKLSIMVHGRLKCFGSCQHLKSKFDEGYSVRVRAPNLGSIPSIDKLIRDKIPNSSLVSVQYLEMKYLLHPQTSVALAFRVMNEAKKKEIILDYSLTQTTLENVFLSMAESSISDKPLRRVGIWDKFVGQ